MTLPNTARPEISSVLIESRRPCWQFGRVRLGVDLETVADPEFSSVGRKLQSGYANQFFGRKLHESERIWIPKGGARPWRPPPPRSAKGYGEDRNR